MMLLRFVMYLLKPSNELLRKRSNGTFIKMCIRLYQSILKWLLKHYRYYAISDTIYIDNGRIKIMYACRDLAFENELKRNGIDISPQMLSREGDVITIKKGRGGCFNYFKWKNITSVYIDDKEFFIKHDKQLSISGNVPADIKSSSPEDIIIRNIIKLHTIQNDRVSQPIQGNTANGPQTQKQKNTQTHNDLFIRDRVRYQQHQNNSDNDSNLEAEQRITKRGFEIDTTF